MKPRARSVYFSIFMGYFPQPAAPPRKHGFGIFIGFPSTALTLLNRPAVCRRHGTGLGQMWEGIAETEEAASQIRVRWRPGRESPKKPDVRHPARADRQHLSLSGQGPLAGTAARRRAQRRPDASRRSPLRHRKRAQRL